MNAPATEGLHLPDGYSREVGAAFENWDFSRLPGEVAHRIKLFVLDTLGVIGAAANAEGIAALNRRLSPRFEQVAKGQVHAQVAQLAHAQT